MTDTAQPMAAESDGIAEAAHAFKVELGQVEAPQRARDESGRFAATEAEEDPDADPAELAEQPDEAPADTDDDVGDDDPEAAEEAQPEAKPLPTSWSTEKAESWQALPPDVQEYILERDGQQNAAVNQKFQEAANVRKAHEAEIMEARNNREQYAQAIDVVLNAVRPQEPPLSMLDINSSDYDPDSYHLKRAQYAQQTEYLNNLWSQRQTLTAQAEAERQQEGLATYHQINAVTKDAFLRDVPDAADQAKAPAVFQELIDYAVKAGAPQDTFQTPTTAMEWHFIWKAREFDRLQEAKAKVSATPPPKPRTPQPAIRPGVTTPRSAVQQASRKKDFARLADSGSISDGAAVFKHFLKGT